jgi:hypothetical protein
LSPSAVQADCVIPIGPTQTSSNDVLSLHSYAEGSSVCIHAFDAANACSYCESGYMHECTGGSWNPLNAFPCDESDAIQPKTTGGQPPPSGQYQPSDSRLCKMLNTC